MRRILLSVTLPISLNAFADAATLAEARQVASSVPPKLLQVLTAEIATGGPEVMTQLRTLDSGDQGVGYTIGQIRGAMTIRKAM